MLLIFFYIKIIKIFFLYFLTFLKIVTINSLCCSEKDGKYLICGSEDYIWNLTSANNNITVGDKEKNENVINKSSIKYNF